MNPLVFSVHPVPGIEWVGQVGNIINVSWELICDVGRYLERTRTYNPFRGPAALYHGTVPALGEWGSRSANCQTFLRIIEWMFPFLCWGKLRLGEILWEAKIRPPIVHSLFEDHCATMHDSVPHDDPKIFTAMVLELVTGLLGSENCDDEVEENPAARQTPATHGDGTGQYVFRIKSSFYEAKMMRNAQLVRRWCLRRLISSRTKKQSGFYPQYKYQALCQRFRGGRHVRESADHENRALSRQTELDKSRVEMGKPSATQSEPELVMLAQSSNNTNLPHHDPVKVQNLQSSMSVAETSLVAKPAGLHGGTPSVNATGPAGEELPSVDKHGSDEDMGVEEDMGIEEDMEVEEDMGAGAGMGVESEGMGVLGGDLSPTKYQRNEDGGRATPSSRSSRILEGETTSLYSTPREADPNHSFLSRGPSSSSSHFGLGASQHDDSAGASSGPQPKSAGTSFETPFDYSASQPENLASGRGTATTQNHHREDPPAGISPPHREDPPEPVQLFDWGATPTLHGEGTLGQPRFVHCSTAANLFHSAPGSWDIDRKGRRKLFCRSFIIKNSASFRRVCWPRMHSCFKSDDVAHRIVCGDVDDHFESCIDEFSHRGSSFIRSTVHTKYTVIRQVEREENFNFCELFH